MQLFFCIVLEPRAPSQELLKEQHVLYRRVLAHLGNVELSFSLKRIVHRGTHMVQARLALSQKVIRKLKTECTYI